MYKLSVTEREIGGIPNSSEDVIQAHAAAIEYYIENYKPFDKAGAYGIQEWIGAIGITKIEGCYFNVVGLPIQKLNQQLINVFYNIKS